MNKYTLLLIAFMCCTLVFQGVLAGETGPVASGALTYNNAKTPADMKFYPNDVMVTNLIINGGFLTPEQEGNLTLDIHLDQLFGGQHVPWFTTDRFLDRADVTLTGEGGSVVSSEYIRDEVAKTTILRVKLANIDTLTK